MSFSNVLSTLMDIKEKFPLMTWAPTKAEWQVHNSTVTITIPVDDETAQLLIDAQAMFAPRDEYRY